jgi:signal transduction histidine kinase
MGERAAAVGGTLTAGSRADGGFEVTATLPTELARLSPPTESLS